MAPRATKSKASPKVPLTDTAAATASAPVPPTEDLAGGLHDIYNDLLSAKTALVDSVPGSGRRQAMIDMEQTLVRKIVSNRPIIFLWLVPRNSF
jgi:hypothetical protein